MSDDFSYRFPYDYPINGTFVVKNIITDSNKTIRIFDYPIPIGSTRDLLKCKGISEADIRSSLLKGELRNKLIAKEISIINSDVDLIQFNENQKQFLQDGGIDNGVEVISVISTLPYLWKEKIPLIGIKNNSNRIFYTPDKFLNGVFITGDRFYINIEHNGKSLYESIDYTIAESAGPGTGYDTINLISFSPVATSLLFATYCIAV